MVLGVRAAVLLLSLARLLAAARQPWPVKLDRTGPCCNCLSEKTEAKFSLPLEAGVLLNESSALEKCFSSLATQTKTSATVAVLSLAAAGEGDHKIPDIELYRGHHLFLLSAFAEHHSYLFRSFTYLPEYLSTEADFRWHKLPLMQDALRPDSGSARNADYLVWMDSDAIVIDFGLSVEALGAKHPSVDIFASADVKLGLVNTGVLILRNTAFTRSFLSSWYSIADRAARCDQEAFDLAYEALPSTAQAKILILPTDALNSHPPAWEHLLAESPVLHLMGESAAYRAKVFQTAAQALCKARSAGVLAPQLSLSREALQHHGREVYRELTQTAFRAANESHAMADEVANLVLQSHRYLDILSLQASSPQDKQPHASVSHGIAVRRLQREVLSVREGVLRLILHKIEIVRRVLHDDVGDLDHEVVLAVQRALPSPAQRLDMLVRLLKQAAEEGNALFWIQTILQEREHIAKLCFQLLDQLLALVTDASAGTVYHMHALMHQNLGSVFIETATNEGESSSLTLTKNAKRSVGNAQLLDKAIEHLHSSLEIFRSKVSLSDEATLWERFHSMQLLATAQCAQQGSGPVTTPWWHEAVAEARRLLEQHPTSFVAREKLAIVLSNAATCYRESPHLPARDWAKESVNILDRLFTKWEGQARGGSWSGGVQTARWRDLRAHAQHVLDTVSLPEMQVQMAQGQMQYLHGEEEWEECTDDMTDCEDFVVVSSEANSASSQPLHNLRGMDPSEAPYFLSDEAHLYVHLTTEEADELRQVRSQYAHTAQWTANYRETNEVWSLVFMEANQPQFAEQDEKRHSVQKNTSHAASSPSMSSTSSLLPSTEISNSKGNCAAQDRALIVLQQEVHSLRTQIEHYRNLLMNIHNLTIPLH